MSEAKKLQRGERVRVNAKLKFRKQTERSKWTAKRMGNSAMRDSLNPKRMHINRGTLNKYESIRDRMTELLSSLAEGRNKPDLSKEKSPTKVLRYKLSQYVKKHRISPTHERHYDTPTLGKLVRRHKELVKKYGPHRNSWGNKPFD